VNLHDLAAKLTRATIRGDELTACCPAHEDHSPSLSATIGNNGAIVLHCHAGCLTDAVLSALGLDYEDLYDDEKRTDVRPKVVRTYPYTDADGNLIFEVVRMEPKSFRQRRPDGRGGWEWNLKGIQSRPLYKLADVLKAVETGNDVWLCEGEKDAERLQVDLPDGDVATTIAGGAGKWRDEHTTTLGNAFVTIIADNDQPGLAHAELVRRELEGVAAEVKVVLPAEGKDAHDHLAAGNAPGDFVPYEAPDDIDPAADLDSAEHTSWWPVDLGPLFDGTGEQIAPTLFTRDDGQAILYPGTAHAFNGEPESGKSWAALLACVQCVNSGQDVLYIDFEDTAPTVAMRLVQLGARPTAVMERFTYISPVDPLMWHDKVTAAALEFTDVLAAKDYALAIIDGVTEAMVIHGLDINSNNDVATFYKVLPRRIQREGTATVQIDHVPKAKEGRGRGGIGGQHKLAGIDVSFVFEVVAPFGIGRHGVAKVSIEKDRPGQLRQHAQGRRLADLHLESDPATSTTLRAELKCPEGAVQHTDQWQPTHLMEAISDFIRDCNANGEHPSQHTIEDGVRGKAEYVREALAYLVRDGYVGKGLDGRRKFQHTIITEYREPAA
jgi:hypothetical protein